MTKQTHWSRRDFFKAAGTAAVGTTLASTEVFASSQGLTLSQNTSGSVPKRPFGKTGDEVSILSLGGMFDIPSNMLLLKQAVKLGITYWDTADCYEGGRSETGFGQYFEKYPDDRKNVFLVSKSDDRDPEGMTNLLNRSLERMKTKTIDLYFVHGVRSIDELTPETKKWAEKAKSEQKIRFFGFSTHKNMAHLLSEAAKLGWIDGIMMTYNFRIMHDDDMKAAVDACVKAGIGLTAMKTQGGGSIKTSSDAELAMGGKFLQKGFTEYQAKLKAVWENPNISCICSQMPNMTVLMANAAAAMDKTSLSSSDRDMLRHYAEQTCSGYCTGCAELCESAIDAPVPISDVMRYLMYARSYGDRHRGQTHFREIPLEIRSRMLSADYAKAEKICPQKMPIAKLMKEAATELA